MELKYKEYYQRQSEFEKAVMLLLEEKLYLSAIQIKWASIRSLIFHILEEKGVDFDSTQKAIFEFISLQDTIHAQKCIYYLYTSSIINEWDANTIVTKYEYDFFDKNCSTIKKIFCNE